MAWRSILDATAAEIVRAWFCPHLHRHDTAEGYLIHCHCLHCRETWRIPLHAYREPKGVSPMKKNTDTNRVRKFLGLSAAAVVCFGAVASTPKPAHAFFGDVVGMASDAISLIPGADIATETIARIMGKGGRATEGTQVLNNVILGGQLGEQIQHTTSLFGIDAQTMRAVLGLPMNTYGASRAASMIARDVLESQGMPYDMAAAISEHARIFMVSPDAALSPYRVTRTLETLIQEEDRAIFENVSTVAAQRDASNMARDAMEEAVNLSQGAWGQTQAIMAGNQVNAGVFGKLEAIEAGQQSANYREARARAAEITDMKIGAYQRHADTRDFLTGAYPAPDFGGGAVETVAGNVAADAANGIVSGFLGM
jgi:hypothetical protein